MRFPKIIPSVLTTLLISGSAFAQSTTQDPPANPPSPPSPWIDKLQQKVCSKTEWNTIGGVIVLRVWNTDGTVLQFPAAPSGALTPSQALMALACTPNSKVTSAHTYWVKVDDPTLTLPNAKKIVVTYPMAPADKKPVFNPPKMAWYYGMQDKTCSAIELQVGTGFNGGEMVLLHNSDDTVVSLMSPNRSISPLQQEAFSACGENTGDTARSYRIKVVNPNATIATPARIVSTIPQPDPVK